MLKHRHVFGPTVRPVASNLLVIFADVGMGAQHQIHRLEQVVHPRFRDRAFDHHHQFRLIGGRPHQAPAAVLDGDPDAVDGDEVAGPATFSPLFCIASKCFTTLSTTPYLVSSEQLRTQALTSRCERCKQFGRALRRAGLRQVH